MKNKKLIIIIAIVVIILIGVGVGTYFYLTSDALKFKKSYESLNETKRGNTEDVYKSISIPNKNPIKYLSAKESVEVIKNDDAVIYFGANWCPWCRNAIGPLLKAASDYNIKTVYYVDMNDVRDIYEVKDGALIKTHDEQEGYYDLLDALDSILEPYVLTDEDEKEYDTNEKRILLPTVVAIKNGNIILNHVGTVELDENQSKYDYLTDSQYQELYKVYEEMYVTVFDETCNTEKEC